MKNAGFIALAGTSLLAFAAPAMAQSAEPQPQSGFSDDAIIVTARRKEESIQDVPLTVQAVAGDTLEKLEINRLEDVASVVPGLSLQGGEGGIGGTSSLRGVNFDARASGSSTSVEFYRNDAVIPQGLLFQAVYDISQIEVLRGPQGTLRGRASPSGSITVTTRRPDLFEAGGYVAGLLAEDSRWNIDGAVNVPVIQDMLAVRVAGFAGKNRANEVRGLNLVTGEIDSNVYDETQAIRASVRADPFDGVLLLDFNYEGISREFRSYNQVESFSLIDPAAGPSPVLITAKDRLGVGALPLRSDQNHKIYNWQAQLNLFAQSLTYVGSYVDSTIAVDRPDDFAGIFGVAKVGDLQFSQDTLSRSKQEVHEIRLQNQERLFGLFDYVAGYMQIEGNSPTVFYGNTGIAVPTATPPFGSLVAVVHTGRERFRADKETSFFGNLTLHLGDRTEISGGVRRIKFTADSGLAVDLTGANRGTDFDAWTSIPALRRCFGDASVPNCAPATKATIYSLAAKHNFTDDLMAYASYGTSFRPGNSIIGYGGSVGSFLEQFLNLPDEKSKSYEVGLKSAWLNNRLRFNVSGFYQEFTNYPFRMVSPVFSVNETEPATLITPFNFVAPVNAKIKGVEADLAFDVSRNFNLMATVSFADGEIKNGVFPCVDLNDDNVPDSGAPTAEALFVHVGGNQIDTCVGNASPGSSARWQGSVYGEYAREVGFGSEAFLRGLVTWKGDSAGEGLNPYDSVKAYGLVDLFAGLRAPDGGWDVTLFVKNVFDTNRVLTRSDAPQSTTLRPAFPGALASTNATNYNLISTTLPREFGVSARLSFGSR